MDEKGLIKCLLETGVTTVTIDEYDSREKETRYSKFPIFVHNLSPKLGIVHRKIKKSENTCRLI